MADDIDQFEYISEDTTPEAYEAIEKLKPSIVKNSSEAIAHAQAANVIISGLGAGAAGALVDKKFIDDGFASTEKGIHTNGGRDFTAALENSLESLETFKKENPSQSGEVEKAIDALNQSLVSHKSAQGALDQIKYLATPREDLGDGSFLGSAAKAAGDALDSAGRWWGRNTKQAKEKAEKEQKAREALERDLERLDEILDPNENYLNLSFREQCYIQKNIFNLVKIRNSSIFPKKTQLPYTGENNKNTSIMSGGDPYGFINKLTQNKAISTMFDMPHDILSNLQPEARFYKIELDEQGKDLKQIEITFSGSMKQDGIKEAFKNKRSRGYGVGFKSFEWTLEGSDPFAAKKMIGAKLAIHATTFGELLKDRQNPDGQKFKYADLAIKTGTSVLKKEKDTAECAYDNADVSYDSAYNVNFRLKMVIGYAIPQNISSRLRKEDKEKYEEAIAACFASYDLIPVIHEFNFEDDGRVSFVINYQAYVQNFFDASYFDIFSDDNENTRKVLSEKINEKMRKARKEKTPEKSAEQQDADANKIRKLKTQNLQILLTKLFKQNKVYFYNIPYEELNSAMSSAGVAPFYDSDNKLLNPNDVQDQIAAVEEDIQLNPVNLEQKIKKKEELQALLDDQSLPISAESNKGMNSDSYRQISMFFLYDLIDIILDGINSSFKAHEDVLNEMYGTNKRESDRKIIELEKDSLKKAIENYKKLRILLGPIEIRNPQNNSEFSYISMGEIPISVKYFSEWIASKMLSKDRRSYNLSVFIEELMKNYVSVFLNDKTCSGVKATQNVTFHSTTVVSYGDAGSKSDEISKIIEDLNRGQRKKKDMWCTSDIPTMKNKNSILNVNGYRSETKMAGAGTMERQKNWMIYYAGRSAPGGVLKGKREDDMKAGINHYVMGQSSGIVKNIKLEKTSAPMLKEMRYEQEGYDGLLQLREVYNANIDMFLYPSIYPGTVIFVDPRGFAPDAKEYKFVSEDDKKKGSQYSMNEYELSRYGIGGYYMVTKVQHRIAEGDRSTQIYSIWLHGAMGNNKADNQDGSPVDEQPIQKKKVKCGAVENSNSVCKLERRQKNRDQVGAQPT